MKNLYRLLVVLAMFSNSIFAQTVIFEEDFDGIPASPGGSPGTYVFPIGWTLVNVDNRTPDQQVNYVNKAWIRREDFQLNVQDSCAISTSYYSPSGTADDWMWTPPIAISQGKIALRWRGRVFDDRYPDTYEVRIMTTPPTGTTGNLGNMVSASTLLLTVTSETQNWTNRNIDISAYAGQTVYIGFRNIANDMFLLAIDNIKIESIPNYDAALTRGQFNKEYTQIPLNQTKNGIPLSGTVKNLGWQNLISARVSVKIYNSNNVLIHSNTSAGYNISSGDSITHTFASWVPPAADNYTIEYSAQTYNQTDGVPANNTLSKQLLISNNTFARDDGNPTHALGIGAQTLGYIGVSFTINAPTTLTSLMASFGRGYTGRPYNLSIWNTEPDGKPQNIIATSETLLYPDDNAITVTLPVKKLLSPGKYVITATEFDSTLQLATCANIFTNNTTWVNWAGSPFNDWANIEAFGPALRRTPILRMNVENKGKIYVDGSVASSGNGLSWNSAFKTLVEAFEAVQTFNYIDTIYVAKGTYYPSLSNNPEQSLSTSRANLKIFGGYPNGGGARDLEANTTFISGNIGNILNDEDNTKHLVVIAGVGSSTDSLVIDGFTFMNALASGAGSNTYNAQVLEQKYGGGIYLKNVANSRTIIRNCVFFSNTAASGAAIFANTTSPLLIQNTNFINSVVNENSSTTNAGAIVVDNVSRVTISNANFEYGESLSGSGAIYQKNGKLSILNSRFENHSGGHAGIATLDGTASLTAINNVFYFNTATTNGAGVFSFNSTGTDTLINNLFIKNQSFSSSGNSAGIISISAGTVRAFNNTIYANTAPTGGVGAINITGGTLNAINNIFYKNLVGSAISDISGQFTGSNNSFGNIDPLFRDEENPRGIDGIWRTADDGLKLAIASPALNTGNNGVGLATDITGAPRIQQTTIDLGAYEGINQCLSNQTTPLTYLYKRCRYCLFRWRCTYFHKPDSNYSNSYFLG